MLAANLTAYRRSTTNSIPLLTQRDPLYTETDVNARSGRDGWTGLTSASVTGNRERMLLLLGYGANPDTPDGSGNVPLYWPVRNGWIDVARLLLQHGASPDGPRVSSIARFGDRLDIIDLLLEYGGDPVRYGMARDDVLAFIASRDHAFRLVEQDW